MFRRAEPKIHAWRWATPEDGESFRKHSCPAGCPVGRSAAKLDRDGEPDDLQRLTSSTTAYVVRRLIRWQFGARATDALHRASSPGGFRPCVDMRYQAERLSVLADLLRRTDADAWHDIPDHASAMSWLSWVAGRFPPGRRRSKPLLRSCVFAAAGVIAAGTTAVLRAALGVAAHCPQIVGMQTRRGGLCPE